MPRGIRQLAADEAARVARDFSARPRVASSNSEPARDAPDCLDLEAVACRRADLSIEAARVRLRHVRYILGAATLLVLQSALIGSLVGAGGAQ